MTLQITAQITWSAVIPMDSADRTLSRVMLHTARLGNLNETQTTMTDRNSLISEFLMIS